MQTLEPAVARGHDFLKLACDYCLITVSTGEYHHLIHYQLINKAADRRPGFRHSRISIVVDNPAL